MVVLFSTPLDDVIDLKHGGKDNLSLIGSKTSFLLMFLLFSLKCLYVRLSVASDCPFLSGSIHSPSTNRGLT